MKAFASWLALAALLSSCASTGGGPSCPANAGSMRVYELYFGRSVQGRGAVTESEWEGFRDQVISPNLPAGYTVLDGTGAWLNPDTHVTTTEATKILIAAMADTPASAASINRVRQAYASAFHQEAVGMTTHLACGSFQP